MHYQRLRKYGDPFLNKVESRQYYIGHNLNKWLELYNSGVNTKQIAKMYRVSSATVWERLKPYGVLRSRSSLKSGERNPQWRGDKAGYTALHNWVKRRFKRPELCDSCHTIKALDLANISQEYKRELTDWEWLCRRCHMIKDGRLEKLSGRSQTI